MSKTNKTEWQNKTLSEVCDFKRGLTYSKSDEVNVSKNIVLRANNIDQVTNAMDLVELRYIRDSFQVPEDKKVKKDSIIICTASGSKNHLGKVALINNNYNYAFGGFMGMLTPRKEVDPKYLFYNLISDNYKKFIDELSNGVNINNLKFSDLKLFEIPLPPLPEQQRIVAILEQAFAAVEISKKNTEKNLKNTKEIFETYLEDIFKGHEDWKSMKLGEICENLDAKRIPVTKNVRENGDVPYYGASGIVDWVKDFLFNEDLLLVSEDGANLLARTYPIAFSVSGKIWVNNHAHILRFKEKTTQIFVEYYLNSINLSKYVTGMAQPKLNQKLLNSIPILIPPLSEQVSIVARLDALSIQTKKLQSLYQQKLADLEELKKSLLKKAFNGEL